MTLSLHVKDIYSLQTLSMSLFIARKTRFVFLQFILAPKTGLARFKWYKHGVLIKHALLRMNNSCCFRPLFLRNWKSDFFPQRNGFLLEGGEQLAGIGIQIGCIRALLIFPLVTINAGNLHLKRPLRVNSPLPDSFLFHGSTGEIYDLFLLAYLIFVWKERRYFWKEQIRIIF